MIFIPLPFSASLHQNFHPIAEIQNRSGSVASFRSDRLFPSSSRQQNDKFLTLPYNQILQQQAAQNQGNLSAQILAPNSPHHTLGHNTTAILTKFKNQHLMKPSLFSPTSCSLHSSPMSPVKSINNNNANNRSIIIMDNRSIDDRLARMSPCRSSRDSFSSPMKHHRDVYSNNMSRNSPLLLQNPELIMDETGFNQFPEPPQLDQQQRPVLTLFEEVIEEVFQEPTVSYPDCMENQNLPYASTFRPNDPIIPRLQPVSVAQNGPNSSPMRPMSSDQYNKTGYSMNQSSRTSSNSLACSEALPASIFLLGNQKPEIESSLSPGSSFYSQNNDSLLKFQTFKPESRASTLCGANSPSNFLLKPGGSPVSSCGGGSGRNLILTRNSDGENSAGSN